jgi:phosphonate transport system substrate-binding protein
MKRKYLLLITIVFFVAFCAPKYENPGPQYSNLPESDGIYSLAFAIFPLYNPEKLMQVYGPLITYMNGHLDSTCLTLEVSRDYAAFEEKYRKQTPAFIIANPWQTLQAMKCNYHVIAMAGEPADFKGIFVVRKESTIKIPSDIKGKSISYPAPTSMGACIMPQFFLYEHGIDINNDIVNKYVGSQESAVMNVYLGFTAAGATWSAPWRIFQKDHPKEASALMALWETKPLVNIAVMIRNDLPAGLQKQVQTLLLELDRSNEGRSILAGMESSGFKAASDGDYELANDFIEQFEKNVRKINIP